MRLSERFTGTVRGLTSEGSGVVDHPSGRAVFVPGAWLGEQIEAKITQIKSQFALGELLQVIAPAPQPPPGAMPLSRPQRPALRRLPLAVYGLPSATGR